MQWTSSRQRVWPSAAAAVTVTPVTTAWANSAYVTLEAAAATDSVVTGLIVDPGARQQFEIDLATGAAGSESVFATVRCWHDAVSADQGTSFGGWINFPIGLDRVGAGDRVAVRMRKHLAANDVFTVAATYYEKPIVGDFQTTRAILKCVPSAANAQNMGGNTTPWAWSTWFEMEDSTAAGWVIPAVVMPGWNPDVEFDLQIGVGSAGNEVAYTTIKGCTGLTGGGPSQIMLPNPLSGIPAASRVSLRIRKNGVDPNGPEIALQYFEEPV